MPGLVGRCSRGGYELHRQAVRHCDEAPTELCCNGGSADLRDDLETTFRSERRNVVGDPSRFPGLLHASDKDVARRAADRNPLLVHAVRPRRIVEDQQVRLGGERANRLQSSVIEGLLL